MYCNVKEIIHKKSLSLVEKLLISRANLSLKNGETKVVYGQKLLLK